MKKNKVPRQDESNLNDTESINGKLNIYSTDAPAKTIAIVYLNISYTFNI